MRHPPARAFTLIELLIVIATIMVLVALLLPSFGAALQTMDMTQCKWNLATIYKAHVLWTLDHDRSDANTGAGWAGPITDYLEHRSAMLRCPSCPRTVIGVTDPAGDTPNTPEGKTPPKPPPPPPGVELSEVTIGVIAPDGTLLYEIPLCPSPYWTMYQQRTLPDGRVLIESNVDNNLGRDPKTGYYSDTDFIFTVEYKNGVPCKVTIGDCDGNGDTNYTDFRVSHQPIWNGQRFLKRFAEGHVGETVDLQQEVKEIAKETPIQPSWTVLSKSMGFLGETNYGMSRGSHIDLEGKELLTPDSKLFFILDYPKPVADYAHLGTDDPWSQFFVLDPAKWTPPPGFEHYTCQEVQALRHFGMANVLFCDGHVETLGPDPVTVNDKVLGSYLRPDSSLWRFGTH